MRSGLEPATTAAASRRERKKDEVVLENGRDRQRQDGE